MTGPTEVGRNGPDETLKKLFGIRDMLLILIFKHNFFLCAFYCPPCLSISVPEHKDPQ